MKLTNNSNINVVVLTFCVLLLAVITYLSVHTTIYFNDQRARREQVVKQRLVSIRAAEEVYCRRHGAYTAQFAALVGEGLIADSLTYVPWSDGLRFELEVSSQTSKTGKAVPLMQCYATYDSYLDGLDANAIDNLTADANDQGRFPGLKIGDTSTPNNNAGNWE